MSASEIDIAIGQIEDELRNVKAARDQVDSILGAGSELSQNLNTLALSMEQLVKASTVETQEAAADIQASARSLSKQSDDLEKTVASVKKEIAAITDKSEQSIDQTAASALNSALVQIQETSEICVNSIQSYAAKEFEHLGNADAEIRDSRKQLGEAQSTLLAAAAESSKENSLLLEEVKSISAELQEQLLEVQEIVNLIKSVDYDGIKEKLVQLQESVSNNQQAHAKQHLLIIGMAVGIFLLEAIILACQLLA